MGKQIELSKSFSAYTADAKGPSRGGVVVLQEIFGVNSHIRKVVDRYAELGFDAIAPALFDPIRKDVELGYDAEGRKVGMEIVGQLDLELALQGVQLAVNQLKNRKVSVVGYCWGGSLAFLAACRLQHVAKASAYYGGMIYKFKNEKSRVPVIFHFGEKDHHITLAHVREIEKAQAPAPVYLYPAEHGFNCEQRSSYDAASAALAEERTLQFFVSN